MCNDFHFLDSNPQDQKSAQFHIWFPDGWKLALPASLMAKQTFLIIYTHTHTQFKMQIITNYWTTTSHKAKYLPFWKVGCKILKILTNLLNQDTKIHHFSILCFSWESSLYTPNWTLECGVQKSKGWTWSARALLLAAPCKGCYSGSSTSVSPYP